jgi:hypothetical protein
LASLFGATGSVSNPADGSYIAERIKEGAEYVTRNFMSLCQKTATSCFTSACRANPWRCDGASKKDIDAAVAACVAGDPSPGQAACEEQAPQSNTKFLKPACLDKIGLSKECQQRFALADGKPNTDPEDVFEAAMSYLGYVDLDALKNEMTSSMQNKCNDAIDGCIRQYCGGGNALVCYQNIKTLETNVSAACGDMDKRNPACAFVESKAPTSNDFERVKQALNDMFDPNTVRNAEIACAKTLQNCAEDKCGGEELWGCTKIGSDGNLRVKLEPKSVKAFCWNEVLSDTNCDNYFTVMGQKNNASALNAWNQAQIIGTVIGKDAQQQDIKYDGVFASMLDTLSSLAVAHRLTEYNRRKNQCKDTNVVWAPFANTANVPAENRPAAVAENNENITDTCWSTVTVQAEDDQQVIKELSNVKNWNDNRYFPAGSTITCGSWIKQSAFDGIIQAKGQWKTHEEKNEFRKNVGITTLAVLGGAIGGGAAGYGMGTLANKALGISDTTPTPLTGDEEAKLTNITAALSSLNSARNSVNDADPVFNGSKNRCNSRLNSALGSLKSAITSLSGIEEKTTVKTAKNYVEKGKDNDEQNCKDNAAIALQLIKDAITSLETKKQTLESKQTGKNETAGNVKAGTAIVGALGGGVLAGSMAYQAMLVRDEEKLQDRKDSFEARIINAIQCTVSLPGGGTKKLGLGDSFTLPPL